MNELVTWHGDPALTIESMWNVRGTSDPDETRDRWSELTIHALPSPTRAFVVFVEGRSVVEGENDRHSVMYCPTADDLVRALLRPQRGGGKHLPGYAAEALRAAGAKAPEVRDALASWERAAAWAR